MQQVQLVADEEVLSRWRQRVDSVVEEMLFTFQ